MNVRLALAIAKCRVVMYADLLKEGRGANIPLLKEGLREAKREVRRLEKTLQTMSPND